VQTRKIVHLTVVWISLGAGDIVLTDFSNAFNTVSRDKALASFQIYLPALYPYIESIYGQTSDLWFILDGSIQSILSAEGSQQGDPLGPLVFAVAVLPLLQELQSIQISGGFVRAFIDETTQLATFEQQQRALTFLKSEAPCYCLSLNFQKFKILLGPCDDSSTSRERQYSYMNLCPGMKPHNIILHPSNDPTTSEEVYDVKLLGCPVGSPAFIRGYLCKIATNDLPNSYDSAAYRDIKVCGASYTS
jgi:hypothetical protein